MTRPRVVVIGAGFGGLEVARHLDDAPVDVTIVDRRNFHQFQPLLYQVATAGLNAADVAYPVRGLFQKQPNVVFRNAVVEGVDWDARTLTLGGQDPLPFDHLVVAAGATTTFFDTPGADEHAYPLYTLEDAIRLRNHVLERFESADAHPELVDDGALTFVVVGGGPTGVETAGALAELFDKVLKRDFRTLDVDRAKVILLEMQGHLLAPFSFPSRRHALDALHERGVDIRLGQRVVSIDASAVTLGDGSTMPTQTLIWAAGVRANPLADVLGVEQGGSGRIVVQPDLRIAGRDDAYAIGDIAEIADGALPQLAAVAMQGGRHVAAQIRRRTTGLPTQPFRYRNKGTMATIGRRSAVAELPFGIKLSGSLAWLSWLGLHIFYLIGKRNRASVILSWSWNYVTWDRGPRLILRPEPEHPAAISVADHG
jgi:NADH dehydrogenase